MINTGMGYNTPYHNPYNRNTNPYNNYMGNSNYYSQGNGIMNNNYYNPYLMEKMRQQQLAEQEKINESNANIFNSLRRLNSQYNGEYDEKKFTQMIEEEKELMKPKQPTQEEYIKMQKEQNVLASYAIHMGIQNGTHTPYVHPDTQRILNVNQNIHNAYNKHGINEENINVSELVERLGNLSASEKLQEINRKSRNMSQYYDSDGYKKLINMHTGDSTQYFNSFNSMNLNNNNHNIDPLEVTLPNMPSEYVKRRQKFIESMLGNSGGEL